MQPPKKRSNAPSAAPTGLTPRDMTWRYYAEVMDKFRRLCHGDKELFRQAEDRIRAKRVVEVWERQQTASPDPMMISKAMTEYNLDQEDGRQVETLYRQKLEFRDRLCGAVGKLPDEGWDTFYGRHNTQKKIPFVVRQFELAKHGLGGQP